MKGVFLKAGAICSSFPVGSNAESRVAFAALQLPSGTDPSTAGNWWKLESYGRKGVSIVLSDSYKNARCWHAKYCQ